PDHRGERPRGHATRGAAHRRSRHPAPRAHRRGTRRALPAHRRAQPPRPGRDGRCAAPLPRRGWNLQNQQGTIPAVRPAAPGPYPGLIRRAVRRCAAPRGRAPATGRRVLPMRLMLFPHADPAPRRPHRRGRRARTSLATLALAAHAACSRGEPAPGYEVLARFPHDTSAYTQGLLYHDGVLYESTGRYGMSELRRVDLESGRVLQRVRLPDDRFGEGLALLDGKLYQLTWESGVGYVYDV